MFSSNRPDDTLRNDRLDHPYPEALDLYVGDLADEPITLTCWTATPNLDGAILNRSRLGILDDDHRRCGRTRAGIRLARQLHVAVDTVVRYRTFTQFREALSLPVAGEMPAAGKGLTHVMATEGPNAMD